MLPDPVKTTAQRGRQFKKVGHFIPFIACDRKSPGGIHGRGRDIDPDHFLRTGSKGPHIISEAASRHEEAALHRLLSQVIDQPGAWGTFVPWRFTATIMGFPVR